MKDKIQVAVMGTPVSSTNQGVMALGASLIRLFTLEDCHGIKLLIGHDKSEVVSFNVDGNAIAVQVINCRLSPRSKVRDHLLWIVLASLLYRAVPVSIFRRVLSNVTPWIAALEQADIVGDIRGGDSFSDIYGMRRFVLGFIGAWTALLVKGEIVQLPQTFGPYKRPLARWMARYLLKKSSIVIARDKISQELAQGLVGAGRKVRLSPDVAFSLESRTPRAIDMHPPLQGQGKGPLVGINVNGLIYNGGYTHKNMFQLKLDYRALMPVLVNALLAEHPGEIWLVPHTYGPAGSVESDTEACLKVRQALPEEAKRRVRVVTREYDQHEIKGVIGGCDFFIGSRMHSCIAALSQGVPCVGIAYSMKFEGVFDSVGVREWVVDGRFTNNEQAVKVIIDLYRKRDLVRSGLEREATEAVNKLRGEFRQMISMAAKKGGKK